MEWVIDVLSYTIILNVFIHYVSDFYAENFMYSFAAAIVLKGLLAAILRFEHGVSAWLGKQKARAFKFIKPIVVWSILFLSKFLILEVIDFIFGKKVELHNFIALIVMVIVMIASRKIIYKIYTSLG